MLGGGHWTTVLTNLGFLNSRNFLKSVGGCTAMSGKGSGGGSSGTDSGGTDSGGTDSGDDSSRATRRARILAQRRETVRAAVAAEAARRKAAAEAAAERAALAEASAAEASEAAESELQQRYTELNPEASPGSPSSRARRLARLHENSVEREGAMVTVAQWILTCFPPSGEGASSGGSAGAGSASPSRSVTEENSPSQDIAARSTTLEAPPRPSHDTSDAHRHETTGTVHVLASDCLVGGQNAATEEGVQCPDVSISRTSQSPCLSSADSVTDRSGVTAMELWPSESSLRQDIGSVSRQLGAIAESRGDDSAGSTSVRTLPGSTPCCGEATREPFESPHGAGLRDAHACGARSLDQNDGGVQQSGETLGNSDVGNNYVSSDQRQEGKRERGFIKRRKTGESDDDDNDDDDENSAMRQSKKARLAKTDSVPSLQGSGGVDRSDGAALCAPSATTTERNFAGSTTSGPSTATEYNSIERVRSTMGQGPDSTLMPSICWENLFVFNESYIRMMRWLLPDRHRVYHNFLYGPGCDEVVDPNAAIRELDDVVKPRKRRLARDNELELVWKNCRDYDLYVRRRYDGNDCRRPSSGRGQAGSSSERAGSSSELAGSSSERAGSSSERAGSSSERAGSSSERAGSSSERAGSSSERAGSSSELSDGFYERSMIMFWHLLIPEPIDNIRDETEQFALIRRRALLLNELLCRFRLIEANRRNMARGRDGNPSCRENGGVSRDANLSEGENDSKGKVNNNMPNSDKDVNVRDGGVSCREGCSAVGVHSLGQAAGSVRQSALPSGRDGDGENSLPSRRGSDGENTGGRDHVGYSVENDLFSERDGNKENVLPSDEDTGTRENAFPSGRDSDGTCESALPNGRDRNGTGENDFPSRRNVSCAEENNLPPGQDDSGVEDDYLPNRVDGSAAHTSFGATGNADGGTRSSGPASEVYPMRNINKLRAVVRTGGRSRVLMRDRIALAVRLTELNEDNLAALNYRIVTGRTRALWTLDMAAARRKWDVYLRYNPAPADQPRTRSVLEEYLGPGFRRFDTSPSGGGAAVASAAADGGGGATGGGGGAAAAAAGGGDVNGGGASAREGRSDGGGGRRRWRRRRRGRPTDCGCGGGCARCQQEPGLGSSAADLGESCHGDEDAVGEEEDERSSVCSLLFSSVESRTSACYDDPEVACSCCEHNHGGGGYSESDSGSDESVSDDSEDNEVDEGEANFVAAIDACILADIAVAYAAGRDSACECRDAAAGDDRNDEAGENSGDDSEDAAGEDSDDNNNGAAAG
ncbi:uncharacterized protein LOC101845244, partial [Aplysia californica]|uniref:Uncharacterized protein LOC101845244 n=1 Tax=Aplysia californica TaxID=6500 RepID=A0ABM1VU88_APLCA